MFRNLLFKNQVVENVVVFDDANVGEIKADKSYSKIDGDTNLNSLLQKFKDMNKKRTASGLSLVVLALPLSACGGGSSGDSSTSLPEVTGRAIDGYLANSKVFLSSNPDVFVRTSDAVGSQGSFEGLFGTGSIVVREGVDISTGKTFTGELKAPEGSKVVTPITTIVEAVVSQAAASGNTSVTPAVAAQQVAKGLGLQSTSDILNTDFVESGSAGMAKAAAKVASVISIVTASTGDEVSAAVLGNIATKVAKAGEVGGKANVLNDAAELKNVFQEVRTSQAELFAKQPATLDLDVLIDNVSNVVAKVSAQVDAAASLKDIAATQQAVQDDIVVAFTVDAENPESFDPTVFEAALADIDEGFDAIIAEAVLELDSYIATVDTGLDFEVILDAADVDETVVAIDLDIIDGALEGTIPDELITGFVFGEVELETLDGVLDGTIDAAAVDEILATLPEFDVFPEDVITDLPDDIPDGELPDDLPDDIVDIITGGSGTGGGTGGGNESPATDPDTIDVTVADNLQTKLDDAISAAVTAGETKVILSLAAGRYDQNLEIDTASTGIEVEIRGVQYSSTPSSILGSTVDLSELDITNAAVTQGVLSNVVFDTQGGRVGGESWINGKITVKSDDVTLDSLRLHSYNGALDFDDTSNSNGIEGFTLNNSYLTGFSGGNGLEYTGVGDGTDAGWVISGNLIGGIAGGVGGSLYLSEIEGVEINNNVFWRPAAAHMYLTDTHKVDVENNLFYHGAHADGIDNDGLLGQLVAADASGYGYVGFSGGSGYGYGFGYGYGADNSAITKMGYGYGGYGGGYGYGPSGYLPDGYGLDAYGGDGAKEKDYTFYGRNYIAEAKGVAEDVDFIGNWGLHNSGGIQFWDELTDGHAFTGIDITGNKMAEFINADPDGLLSDVVSRHKSGIVGGVVVQVKDGNNSTGLTISGNEVYGTINEIKNANDLMALIEVGGGFDDVAVSGNTLVWSLDSGASLGALNDDSADGKTALGTMTNRDDSGNVTTTKDYYVFTQGLKVYGDLTGPTAGAAMDFTGNTLLSGYEAGIAGKYVTSGVQIINDLSGSDLTNFGQFDGKLEIAGYTDDYGEEWPDTLFAVTDFSSFVSSSDSDILVNGSSVV